ncbi:hypothetical protein AB6T85_21485 [Erwinia sp. ACCC 02193]|jgi:hypothetical protein|uniref:Uncharacterized protein n=1 Tax=Erwinia aeris TaxID=3239803 RepID=A0ABV4EDG5_9GAMM
MGGVIHRIFLSLPHQLEPSELVATMLNNIGNSLTAKGYELSSPAKVIGFDDVAALAVLRLSMLIACDSVWFPKDFQRSALSVGEYNYAYALRKSIVIDPVRRLLD